VGKADNLNFQGKTLERMGEEKLRMAICRTLKKVWDGLVCLTIDEKGMEKQ